MTMSVDRAALLRLIPKTQRIISGATTRKAAKPPQGFRVGDVCVVVWSTTTSHPPAEAMYRIDIVERSAWDDGGWLIRSVRSHVPLDFRPYPSPRPAPVWKAIAFTGAPPGNIVGIRARDLWRDNDASEWMTWRDLMEGLEPYWVQAGS